MKFIVTQRGMDCWAVAYTPSAMLVFFKTIDEALNYCAARRHIAG